MGAPLVESDWEGLRTFLTDHGVDLTLSYINEVATSVRGGASQETQDAEQIYFAGAVVCANLFALDVLGALDCGLAVLHSPQR